ncbi:MAG: hypothetical protein COA57_07495 [Flavobacteriales bacterium]|nr:MAG: hypothetical protein COA57_07495 [Flavobacteriales bacterium]
MKVPVTKIIISFFLIATLTAIAAQFIYSYSYTPPLGMTNAPNESNCSVCHNVGQLNDPNGKMSILLNNNDSGYLPDSIYPTQVNLQLDSNLYFGFELTVLDSAGNKAGKLIMKDSNNTAVASQGGREYISHFQAWQNTSSDSATWQFDWVAPSSNVGEVIFYASGVAAPSAPSIAIGTVFTTMLRVSADSIFSSTEELVSEKKIRVFPNPSAGFLFLDFSFNSNDAYFVNLFDLNGTLIWKEPFRPRLNINELNSGTYLLAIEFSEKIVFTEKIVVLK